MVYVAHVNGWWIGEFQRQNSWMREIGIVFIWDFVVLRWCQDGIIVMVVIDESSLKVNGFMEKKLVMWKYHKSVGTKFFCDRKLREIQVLWMLEL